MAIPGAWPTAVAGREGGSAVLSAGEALPSRSPTATRESRATALWGRLIAGQQVTDNVVIGDARTAY
jgi:hypothetical protein